MFPFVASYLSVPGPDAYGPVRRVHVAERRTAPFLQPTWGACAGQYGYAEITDFATVLKPSRQVRQQPCLLRSGCLDRRSWSNPEPRNPHREGKPAGSSRCNPERLRRSDAINFSWGDKIEPRLGAAWGSRDGKMKIFGSYGVINDVMKLLLAQTSWGAQGYNNCTYPLGPDSQRRVLALPISPLPSSMVALARMVRPIREPISRAA